MELGLINLSLNCRGKSLSKATQSIVYVSILYAEPEFSFTSGRETRVDKNEHVSVSLHAGFSRRKGVMSWRQLRFNRKDVEVKHLCLLKNGIKYFRKGIFNAKTLSDCKSEKYEAFCAITLAPIDETPVFGHSLFNLCRQVG